MSIQRQIQLTQHQTEDILHAIDINFQTLKLASEENIQHNVTLIKIFAKIQKLKNQLNSILKMRRDNFSQYLIYKLIQNQQEQIRRERLFQYEHKIYQIQRIISDKQTHFESLIRPKMIPRKNGLQNSQKIKKSAQKYRLLLEQIDEHKQFMKNIKSTETNSVKKIKQINKSYIFKKTSAQSNVNLKKLNDFYMTSINSVLKSLNTSIVLGSSNQNKPNNNQLNCPQNQQKNMNLIQDNLNNPVFSHRSCKAIDLYKQKRFEKIESQYNRDKKFNSFPLPFYLNEQIRNPFHYHFQEGLFNEKFKKTSQLFKKILKKKQQNQMKYKKIQEQVKQIQCLKQILACLESKYNKIFNL